VWWVAGWLLGAELLCFFSTPSRGALHRAHLAGQKVVIPGRQVDLHVAVRGGRQQSITSHRGVHLGARTGDCRWVRCRGRTEFSSDKAGWRQRSCSCVLPTTQPRNAPRTVCDLEHPVALPGRADQLQCVAAVEELGAVHLIFLVARRGPGYFDRLGQYGCCVGVVEAVVIERGCAACIACPWFCLHSCRARQSKRIPLHSSGLHTCICNARKQCQP